MVVYEVIKDNFFVGVVSIHDDKITLLEGAELYNLFREASDLDGNPVTVKMSGRLFRLYLNKPVASANKLVLLVMEWLDSHGYRMAAAF